MRVRDFRTAGIPKPYYEKIGVMCPKCGDDIVIKKTKKGRRYYGCINNPECDFMSWQKPQKRNVQNVAEQWLKKEIKLCAWMNNVVM